MRMFRNLSGGEDGSHAIVVRFGLLTLVLLVICVGAIAFTTRESIHNIDAVDAGMRYAREHGWDEPNGQNIADTVISISGVKTLRPAVSQYCGCPREDCIAKTGDLLSCAEQRRCADGNIQGHYIEVSAVFTPTLAKLLPVPWTLTEKSVTRIR